MKLVIFSPRLGWPGVTNFKLVLPCLTKFHLYLRKNCHLTSFSLFRKLISLRLLNYFLTCVIGLAILIQNMRGVYESSTL